MKKKLIFNKTFKISYTKSKFCIEKNIISLLFTKILEIYNVI